MPAPLLIASGVAAYLAAPALGKKDAAVLRAAGVVVGGIGVWLAIRGAKGLVGGGVDLLKGFGEAIDTKSGDDQSQTPAKDVPAAAPLPPFKAGVEAGWKISPVLAKIIDPLPDGKVSRSIWGGRTVPLVIEVVNGGDKHQWVTIDVHVDLDMISGFNPGPLAASSAMFKSMGHSTRRLTLSLDVGDKKTPIYDIFRAYAAARVFVNGKQTHATVFQID